MNSELAYITGSVVIAEHQVLKNGELLWEQDRNADLNAFLRAAYDQFSGHYPKFHKMDALSKLGWLAAEVLLKDIDNSAFQPEETGLLLSNRSSSLDTDVKYFETVKEFASPALFVYTLPNIVMGEISIRHGFKGENTFFVSERFDAELMSAYATQLLATTPLKRCLCGWVEVMDQQYETAMFLVSNEPTAQPLTAGNLNAIYQIK
ncbi:hypothetical protein SAMN05660909_01345 [Chitinophaga terrae (ex Kim and Jung 2007)]|uniref:3-oxoacyl-ACP synthase n=1 Tax=Chitinophaga terrae (ex Kim and Jung 2007) TaxID=408074 RepID=A0A1H3ZY35_9BACT|nr:hypothetical protein [Chitinophaga terrae (ex Kim and Jung 2007)]MDQ0106148.1 hypothetical protein [Chitinophaga terrae (ex Kim and Jung 2007)]SEA28214.1 hypothetical protein SAMN05660909_01345 [Chitinophaga terrae (ex Kim and Jung 2007)]